MPIRSRGGALRSRRNMKTIRLTLDDKQAELLGQVSKATHISKSALVRKGIDLVLREMKEDIISPELRREIATLLREDADLLRRLAKA